MLCYLVFQSAGSYDDMQGVQSSGYKTDMGVTRKCKVAIGKIHKLCNSHKNLFLWAHRVQTMGYTVIPPHPPVHTTNKHKAYLEKCRDDVKVLWCYSYLNFLVGFETPSLQALKTK